jgi:cysteine desulfurase
MFPSSGGDQHLAFLSMIYLDHNATTPVDPDVCAAMAPYLSSDYGNPSSGYSLGQRSRNALETARVQVAQLLGCETEDIVFTSGGTESNNTVIKGVAHTCRHQGAHLITTAIEHPAVLKPCLFLMEQGWDITFLPVDSGGLVDPSQLRKAIRKTTVLVSVMHANNETGTVQPVEEIGHICRHHGVMFHTDAAQSVGKIPVNISDMKVDFLTLAGHKVYAPKGIGALYIRKDCQIEPLMHGAGQESGRRAGTENVALAVALGAACRLAADQLSAGKDQLRALRDRFHRLLSGRVPGLVLNGHPDLRLPNTLNVSFPGIEGSQLLEAVPEIWASTGAACHDRSVRLSHVLAAMNVPPEIGRGAVRLSLGRQTTPEDIDRAADLLLSAYDRLKLSPAV